MSSHHATPDEPSQSDLRALWRSMRGKDGVWGWHPVSIPLWFLLIPIMQVYFTVMQLRLNRTYFSIATLEESLTIRAATTIVLWGVVWWLNAHAARHWPGTNLVTLSRRMAFGCFAVASGIIAYGLLRVGPSGLLVGLASEWFEGSIFSMTGPAIPAYIIICGLVLGGRRGRQPHCADCEYPVDEHMSRCPECGHTLSGPWRIVLGRRANRKALTVVVIVLFMGSCYLFVLTDWGRNLHHRGLAIVPKDRMIAAAASGRYWDDGVEYQMWSRAWNEPGDRRRIVDAMLALPEDVFREHHAELVLGIMLDPDTPDDLRAELLRWLAISVGGIQRSGGPAFLAVGTDPAATNIADHHAKELGDQLAIAFRVRQDPGVAVGFNTQSAAPTNQIGAPPPAPPNWQDDAFLPGSMIQPSSGLGLPIELHDDAPDAIEVEVWLLLDTPYRFGTPAFHERFAPFSHRYRRQHGQAFPPTTDGRPDIGAPDPMAMRFVLPVPTDFLHSMENPASIQWSGMTIGIQHAE